MQKTRLQTSKASLIPKHSSTRLQRLKRDIYAYRYIYLLMLPALVYVSIFQYGPMYGAQIAFRDFRARLGIWGSEWVGLENFIRFFIYPSFWKILRNTAGLSAYGIIAGFPMPVLLALFLNEARSRRLKKNRANGNLRALLSFLSCGMRPHSHLLSSNDRHCEQRNRTIGWDTYCVFNRP